MKVLRRPHPPHRVPARLLVRDSLVCSQSQTFPNYQHVVRQALVCTQGPHGQDQRIGHRNHENTYRKAPVRLLKRRIMALHDRQRCRRACHLEGVIRWIVVGRRLVSRLFSWRTFARVTRAVHLLFNRDFVIPVASKRTTASELVHIVLGQICNNR
jgi:hypothetical protein